MALRNIEHNGLRYFPRGERKLTPQKVKEVTKRVLKTGVKVGVPILVTVGLAASQRGTVASPEKAAAGLIPEGKNVPAGEHTGIPPQPWTSEVQSNDWVALWETAPVIKGPGEGGILQAGVFSLDLTENGKLETLSQVAYPNLIYSDDFDRFLAVQLVRADGGQPIPFFKKVSREFARLGKPDVISKQQWESILAKASPQAFGVWQKIENVPPLDLPAPKGRKFEWNPSLIPQEILDIPEDEHRLIYWMARAKFDLPWPLDQGEAGGINWASKRVGPHLYENWFKVKTTSYILDGPSDVGPEGSIPYISLSPYAGYPPLGQWIEP